MCRTVDGCLRVTSGAVFSIFCACITTHHQCLHAHSLRPLPHQSAACPRSAKHRRPTRFPTWCPMRLLCFIVCVSRFTQGVQVRQMASTLAPEQSRLVCDRDCRPKWTRDGLWAESGWKVGVLLAGSMLPHELHEQTRSQGVALALHGSKPSFCLTFAPYRLRRISGTRNSEGPIPSRPEIVKRA